VGIKDEVTENTNARRQESRKIREQREKRAGRSDDKGASRRARG
jgi:hypothetical protein